MVCEKCEKKLTKVICPDVWKDGSRNTSESRKLNENKLLSKSKRYSPYAGGKGKAPKKCKTCKAALHQDAIYCATCSYKEGVCAMCGVKILDTSAYRQSLV